MNKFFIRIGCIVFAGMVLSVSCKNTLDVAPTHMVPVGQMWQVKNDARSAVFGTYGLLRAALSNNNAYLAYGELRAGDFVSTSRSDIAAVTTNDLKSNEAVVEEWKNWRRFYAVVAQANLCLERLPKVRENDFRYTAENLKLDIANVRYLRALTYFYLVRIWGNVPMITRTAEGAFQEVQREDQQKVLDFVTQEALAALNDLPWRYNGQSPEQSGLYWEQSDGHWRGIIATKGAAYQLLAHISAWRGNYLDTEKYTRLAIDNKAQGGYDIVDIGNLTNTQGGVFQGQAVDVLLALPANKDFQEASATGHIEDWTLALPYISRKTPDIYIPNDTILQVFDEKNDNRFSVNENGTAQGNYFTGFGSPIPMFSKIRQLSTTGADPLRNYQSSIVIFRYEDLVLLRAEALIYLGATDKALQLLNSIRSQRGLPEYKAVNGNVANAIMKERRRELLGEGWRWFDLVRFEQVPGYTRLTAQDIKAGALYWPLAKEVMNGNGTLQQNEFWQH
jgi:hypothetical protein